MAGRLLCPKRFLKTPATTVNFHVRPPPPLQLVMLNQYTQLYVCLRATERLYDISGTCLSLAEECTHMSTGINYSFIGVHVLF